MALKDVLIAMEQIGLTDVVLPFILVFTVVFAVLQKTKVLGVDANGQPKANYNAMVALVLAFLVLVMVRTLAVVTWFTRYVALLLVAFIFLGILFTLLGVHKHHRNALTFLALLLLSAVFLQALAFAGVLDTGTANQLFLSGLAVLVFAGLVWFMLGRAQQSTTVQTQRPARTETPHEPAQGRQHVRAQELTPGEEREL